MAGNIAAHDKYFKYDESYVLGDGTFFLLGVTIKLPIPGTSYQIGDRFSSVVLSFENSYISYSKELHRYSLDLSVKPQYAESVVVVGAAETVVKNEIPDVIRDEVIEKKDGKQYPINKMKKRV
jgi:hypothetical protein